MWVLTSAGHKALSPFTLFSLNFDTGFFLPYRLQSGRFHTVKNKDGPFPLSNIRPYQAQGTPTNHSLVLRQWAAPASGGCRQLSPRAQSRLSGSEARHTAQDASSAGRGPYQPRPARPPQGRLPHSPYQAAQLPLSRYSLGAPWAAWGDCRDAPAPAGGPSREVWPSRPGVQT